MGPKAYMRVSQNYGYFFRGPYSKDWSLLGSILGFPFREIPYIYIQGLFTRIKSRYGEAIMLLSRKRDRTLSR